MKTQKDNHTNLRITATLALTAGLLLAGCDRPPENDLEQWVNANAVQPFDRIEFKSKNKDDNPPKPGEPPKPPTPGGYWVLKRDGDRYRIDWPHLSLGAFAPAGVARQTPENRQPSVFDKLDHYFEELEHRRVVLEKAHPYDTRFVPLEKVSKSLARSALERMKQHGFAGSGQTYLVLSRARCADERVKAEFERVSISKGLDGINKQLSKEIDQEIDRLEASEKKKVEAEFHTFLTRTILLELGGMRPATSIFACAAGLAPAYQASLIYIEGERGTWLPPSEIAPDSATLQKRLAENVIDACGFPPDTSAVPAWARLACRDRQRAGFEATNGIAGSRAGLLGSEHRYWFYTRAGLGRFMDAVSWPAAPGNEADAAKLIAEVHTTGGAQ